VTLHRFAFRTLPRTRAFWEKCTGYYVVMGKSDDLPAELPDDVPVADAVEQQLPAVNPPIIDDEAPEDDDAEVPLEAAPPDWQEQHEPVVVDPELDEFGRG
jgi:hypothetical protein